MAPLGKIPSSASRFETFTARWQLSLAILPHRKFSRKTKRIKKKSVRLGWDALWEAGETTEPRLRRQRPRRTRSSDVLPDELLPVMSRLWPGTSRRCSSRISASGRPGTRSVAADSP